MNDILTLVLIVWFCGWQMTYVILIRRYMQKFNIKNIKNASKRRGAYANKLFLTLAWYWPLHWIKEKK
jgi:hypothetical protein